MYDEIISQYKSDLINHLKTLNFTVNVNSLWGYSKSYFLNRNIIIGGCYSSDGDHITVTFNYDGKILRFDVTFEDLIRI